LPRAQLIFEVVDSIGAGDIRQTLERVDALISSGLSPDGFMSALSDHLRNLLIALTCGKESGLLDIPGIPESDLYAQSAKFDAATLAQNIAILEDLRRNMRQNQTGRAMLDATLVRLALAKQFSSIDELLSRGGGAAPASAPVEQKKNAETVRVSPPPSPPRPIEQPRPVEVSPPAAPIAGEPPSSLWSGLLAKLQTQTGFSTILGVAKLAGIENDVAIIRLPPTHDTFVKMWNSNGKKDKIASVLTELRGQPTGVRIEIDSQQAETAPAKPIEAEAGPIVEFVLKEFGGRLTGVE
jgi:DNA polymerase III gamma/tau subunit